MDKSASILSAALKLFVQYGFHGTPTSKIASEAGVSNGTLFHYFKTKDDLVVALYNHTKQDLNAHLFEKINEGKTIKEKFRNMFVYSLRWGIANREEYYFLQQFHFSPHLALVPAEDIAKHSRQHTQLLEGAVQAGIFKNLPTELIATLAWSQINGMYEFLVKCNLCEEKQNQIINDAFDLTWLMLVNPE
jgi:AcrR family transcriptional regulator